MSFCGGLNSYSAQFLFPASLNVNYEMNKKKRVEPPAFKFALHTKFRVFAFS
jgi:hypothetical protein